jgi:hypothetical protein
VNTPAMFSVKLFTASYEPRLVRVFFFARTLRARHPGMRALFWVRGLLLVRCIDSKVALKPRSMDMIPVRMGLPAGVGGDNSYFFRFDPLPNAPIGRNHNGTWARISNSCFFF